MFRRDLLKGVAATSVAGLLQGAAPLARSNPQYPSGPVRFVVPASPGGVQDLTTRAVARNLAERLGWTVLVDNKPGGNFSIAAEAVARSKPDGLTILQASRTLTILPFVQAGLNYDINTDLAPVIRYFGLPAVLAVHPSLPVNTLQELVAYSKANKATLNYATPGIGTTTHLLVELLKKSTGLDMQDVPYRDNSIRMADTLTGRVQVSINGMSAAITDAINTGKLRALAVLGHRRATTLPSVPTTYELGIARQVDFDPWFGFMVAGGTPGQTIQMLCDEVRRTMSDPRIRKLYQEQGAVFFDDGPEMFAKKLSEDKALWKAVVTENGLKPT